MISDEIPSAHLDETTALLGRPPFLWDNLFANDGPRNCKFLKLRFPTGRTRDAFARTRGWAWNPMNQAALSGIAIRASRHAVVEDQPPEEALTRAVRESCTPGLARFVLEHRAEFLDQGLDKILPETKNEWRAELRAFGREPVAHEIDRWLAGEYVVGAECLTD